MKCIHATKLIYIYIKINYKNAENMQAQQAKKKFNSLLHELSFAFTTTAEIA